MANPLFAYRTSNGMSQGDVADKLGVSRAMVSHWEKGKRKVTPTMANRMQKELGIDRMKLLDFFHKAA